MWQMFKDMLKRCLPPRLYHYGQIIFRSIVGRRHYSLFGEDIALSHFLPQKKGIYVDVGAHHPMIGSNTYLFYKKGWRGVVIDPLPGMKKRFNRFRPRDAAFEVAVGKVEGERVQHVYAESMYNTFDPARVEWLKSQGIHPFNSYTLTIKSLRRILEEIPWLTQVDLLNIDVEGMDLEVLESFDWQRFKPEIICVEIWGTPMDRLYEHPITRFITAQGYELVSYVLVTCIFARKK